jgi:hypothetical protein
LHPSLQAGKKSLGTLARAFAQCRDGSEKWDFQFTVSEPLQNFEQSKYR